MKKLTDSDIAAWYGLSRNTLINYKKGSIEEQRRYYALREYAERHYPMWRIDYANRIADHGDMVVEIVEGETGGQLIDGKVLEMGFVKGGKKFGLIIREIDKALWAAIMDDPKIPARLASELGDEFSLIDWVGSV